MTPTPLWPDFCSFVWSHLRALFPSLACCALLHWLQSRSSTGDSQSCKHPPPQKMPFPLLLLPLLPYPPTLTRSSDHFQFLVIDLSEMPLSLKTWSGHLKKIRLFLYFCPLFIPSKRFSQILITCLYFRHTVPSTENRAKHQGDYKCQ